jgi:hypothetical protein
MRIQKDTETTPIQTTTREKRSSDLIEIDSLEGRKSCDYSGRLGVFALGERARQGRGYHQAR